MEDFRVIYRILKYLQQSMDFEEFDCAGFTAASVRIRTGFRHF